jgi:hypothetical protein
MDWQNKWQFIERELVVFSWAISIPLVQVQPVRSPKFLQEPIGKEPGQRSGLDFRKISLTSAFFYIRFKYLPFFKAG